MSEIGWDKETVTPHPGERWPPLYIRDGLYADRLSPWLKRFGPSRMLIMRSEDLFADPRDVYKRTLKFLGMEYFDLGQMKAYNVGSYSDADPTAIDYLRRIYAEPNRRLKVLLGPDFDWDNMRQTAPEREPNVP
jgi:hypothetical protein